MVMGSGLLALAMLAADGPTCLPEETTFQVRVLTIDGLDWRTSAYTRLQPVARQGTSTIWTADRVLALTLAERSKSASKIGGMFGVTDGTWSINTPVTYVAAMERVANGPVNQSTAIAFMPRPELIDEHFAVKVTGRKLDQGVLANVEIDETHIDAIHQYSQSEALKSAPGKSPRTPAEVGLDVWNAVLSSNPGDRSTNLTSTVQIPEITQSRVAGEWLIPKDGVLIVSLGVKTASDDQGKAVVRERLAVIEANPPSIPGTFHSKVEATADPMPIAVSTLGMPALPLRSMPRPIDPSGQEVELPPLPEAVASADLDRIKPDQPSPQTTVYAIPEADSAIARTSYTPFVATSPRSLEIPAGSAEARSELLDRLLRALSEAGVNVDLDPSHPTLKSARRDCEKCDGDSTFCPADAREVPDAGGIKLAPQPTAEIGISVKDRDGVAVFDSAAPLTEALKSPGKTETKMIPIGENLSLEIKATVVSTAPKSEARKATNPAPRR